MLTYAIATLFVLGAVAAASVIVDSLRRAAPDVAALRGQLRTCDQRMGFSFRIDEVVCRVDDGKIVRLPVRVRLASPAGLRAAA